MSCEPVFKFSRFLVSSASTLLTSLSMPATVMSPNTYRATEIRTMHLKRPQHLPSTGILYLCRLHLMTPHTVSSQTSHAVYSTWAIISMFWSCHHVAFNCTLHCNHTQQVCCFFSMRNLREDMQSILVSSCCQSNDIHYTMLRISPVHWTSTCDNFVSTVHLWSNFHFLNL